MRGDDVLLPDDFLLDTLTAAFELKKPDARQKAVQALRRADGTPQAREIEAVIKGHRNRPLAAEDAGPTPETIVHQRRRQRGDTVEQLVASRKLEWHQQAAAEQIGRRPWAAWMSDPRSLFQFCPACQQVHTVAGRLPMCGCGARRLWRAPPHLGVVQHLCRGRARGGGEPDDPKDILTFLRQMIRNCGISTPIPHDAEGGAAFKERGVHYEDEAHSVAGWPRRAREYGGHPGYGCS